MKNIFNYMLLCATILFCTSCGNKSIQVNGMQSTVIKVISGNRVELQNGTTVVLIGISDSENSKMYLEQHIKGKRIRVISDSKQPQYIKSYLTTIYGYICVVGEKGCVQRKLLQTRLTTINTNMQCDSLSAFSDICKAKQHPLLSTSQLRTTMIPATFLIQTNEGCGTGFFINDNGLALTNNHVWDGTSDAIIYKLTYNGDFDASNSRPISRILATYKDGRIDFTIFMVQLESGEKTAYLPLADQKTPLGEQVAKLGCALTEAANFNIGVLSKYGDGFITHSINTNNGDSGSPICNMYGEVVGIHVSSRVNPESGELARGLSYGTDALLIKQCLDQLQVEYGR